jgi:hypothetical protein
MNGYIAIDSKGWVTEIHMDETGVNHDSHISDGHIPFPYGNLWGCDPSHDIIRKLIHSQMIMFYDGKQFCQVKNPKDIWKRILVTNLHGPLASNEHQKLLDSLDSSFPDVPTGTIIETPPPLGKAFEPSFECEIKPGLKVGLSSEEDIDLWESQMVKSGLYTAEEAWKVASLWFSDHMTWPVKTTWKDKPIQLELYILNRGTNNVMAGYNDHIDRARPLWFWKQVALPTFKTLYGYGFENINSQVRIDKPNYVKFLTEAYGHEVLRKTNDSFILRLNIKDAIKNIGDWPARKTMGPDWKWEKDGISVREATDVDLPTIYSTIDTSWGDNSRKQLSLYNLDSMWNLDSASILLSLYDGKIIEARIFRERKDKITSLRTNILRTVIDDKTNLAMTGMLEWQAGVGYEETSFIIETKLFERVKDQWLARGWKVFSQDQNITECRMNVKERLNANL